ncbi:signal peptidase I [Pseudonocardia acaciae]|uniref:signal peptidase I n=1 Tax=Pseudonocardia acaciae TaxID=551276 RepID=UPI0006873732|nr:signal peptidase I [Pseudonocardia acaciae]
MTTTDGPASDAPAGPATAERGGRRRRLLGLALTVVALAVALPAFVARAYAVPSDSMESTLHGCPGCENDHVLVDKLAYHFGTPRPGDIVVFVVPTSWRNSELPGEADTDFIKRVIAVGGQTVSCCDDRGRVMVDGRALDEPYIHFAPEYGPAVQARFGPVRVPDGQLWVMGDNRNDSVDSRAPNNGPVPVSDVIGKARMIVLPFGRFGGIQ